MLGRYEGVNNRGWVWSVGIPPHIQLYAKRREIKESQNRIQIAIKGIHNRDKEFQNSLISKFVDKLNKLNRLKINGVELSLDPIQDHMSTPLQAQLTTLSEAILMQIIITTNGVVTMQQQDLVQGALLQLPAAPHVAAFVWDNEHHMMSEDFTFNRKYCHSSYGLGGTTLQYSTAKASHHLTLWRPETLRSRVRRDSFSTVKICLVYSTRQLGLHDHFRQHWIIYTIRMILQPFCLHQRTRGRSRRSSEIGLI